MLITKSVLQMQSPDGIEIAPNSAYTFTVDYAGGIGDTTPPPTPYLTACAGSTPDTLTATWTAYDPDSAITLYEYAIGTNPGGIEVVNWTTTSEESFIRTGLVLTPGQTYFVSVRARATKAGYAFTRYHRRYRRVWLLHDEYIKGVSADNKSKITFM